MSQLTSISTRTTLQVSNTVTANYQTRFCNDAIRKLPRCDARWTNRITEYSNLNNDCRRADQISAQCSVGVAVAGCRRCPTSPTARAPDEPAPAVRPADESTSPARRCRWPPCLRRAAPITPHVKVETTELIWSNSADQHHQRIRHQRRLPGYAKRSPLYLGPLLPRRRRGRYSYGLMSQMFHFFMSVIE